MINQAQDLALLLEIVQPILHNRCISIPTNSIETRVELDGETVILRVDGFYKHGAVELKIIREADGQPQLQITDRYGKKSTYYNPTFSDLVSYNFYCWQDYKDRGYEIDKSWAPHLLAAGLIKAETQVVYSAS